MTVIASGNNVILRDRLSTDVDRYIYWQTHGEGRLIDAPWEGVYSYLKAEQETSLRSRFLESCTGDLPSPRKTAVIAGKDNQPLGWVTRYDDIHSPDTLMAGISIGEDDSLNHGLDTEALGLWVDYLFTNSKVHRIGLDTWSFNPRMIHVVEKLGLIYEGQQREVLQWNNKWLDQVHFGILRPEWEEHRKIKCR
jgi:RimJ/RimL family protein N-acetyltransferase